MSYQIVFTDELYHHGIKGQKWGIRKYQNPDGSLTAEGKARYGIKEARREYRSARKDYRKAARKYNRTIGFGIKGIDKGVKRQKVRDEKAKVMEQKRLGIIDAKAKRAGLKSDKKEFNTYVKTMNKTGLANSVADAMSGGKSKSLYTHLKKTKGKKYADAVQKKVQNRSLKALAVSGTATVGLLATSAYMNHKLKNS